MRTLMSLLAAEDPTQTHHWLLPETAEIIYGGIASVIVVSLLVKFAGPIAKKALADRTSRIQSDIDNARASKSAADEEATKIRAALGDIAAERGRILGEADKQAEALLVEGRARLEAEVREMEAKAEADIAAAAARSGDELRGEIARLSARAAEQAVSSALDDRAQQDLIESFISSVGAAR
jgi:F-type H+-transporting ATPase subunit b